MQLLPRLSFKCIRFCVLGALIGSLSASVYGIIHDQITYSLSPEYYTHFKFHQFGYEESALPHRWLATKIGVLASWWVGLIAGWLLARAAWRAHDSKRSYLRLRKSVAILFFSSAAVAILFALKFTFFGNHADPFYKYSFELSDETVSPFILVGNIHNGSYLGSFLSLIILLILMIRQNVKERKTTKN